MRQSVLAVPGFVGGIVVGCLISSLVGGSPANSEATPAPLPSAQGQQGKQDKRSGLQYPTPPEKGVVGDPAGTAPNRYRCRRR